jgi:aspartyl-tRNA(Asn)/glutamyl-tRNA(Gln) amidotransferase subunit C
MSVTKADIERVAALASLEVDEKALPELTTQIGGILEYVEQLKDAPQRSETVSAHVTDAVCPLRDDVINPDQLDRKPKELAPEFKEGLFIVPAIGRIDDA